MEQLTRRQWFVDCARSAASIFLAAHGLNCSIPASIEIISKPKDIGQHGTLGFVQGKTNLKQAISLLRKKGASGISLSGGIDVTDGKTIMHALTADHIGAVFFFRNMVLSKTFELRAEKGTDKGIYLKVLAMGKSNAVVVASGSLLYKGINGILVLAENPQKRIHIAYDYFPDWIFGMKDPMIKGTDLAEGVTFVARKATEVYGEYTTWDYGAILKCDGKAVSVEKKIMQEFLSCECIYDWYNNPPEKRKKDELVAPFLDF